MIPRLPAPVPLQNRREVSPRGQGSEGPAALVGEASGAEGVGDVRGGVADEEGGLEGEGEAFDQAAGVQLQIVGPLDLGPQLVDVDVQAVVASPRLPRKSCEYALPRCQSISSSGPCNRRPMNRT